MRVRYIPSLPGESMTSESLRNPVAMKSTPASLSNWAEVIGRFGLALLFLWSGYEKLAHPASTVAYMQAFGLPAADLLMWPALLLELAGGRCWLSAGSCGGWRSCCPDTHLRRRSSFMPIGALPPT